MPKKHNHKLAPAALVLAGGMALAGCAGTGAAQKDPTGYSRMSPEALAEHLLFNSNSFKLEEPTQEGGVARDRLVQDETQKLCSALRNRPADPQTAQRVKAVAQASLRYPEGGIRLGDWRIGFDLAWSGEGWRIGHRVDDHSKLKNGPGANCYNCHDLTADRDGGTIGPSLRGYGKRRGMSEATLRYTYEMIYNPNLHFPCTRMPRFGAKGLLTQEQIAHVMAFLLDPASPVNQ
ncbi:sulfur oxidation c-type cytochrome SoxX [Inmirania thermothiophila]|uniref:Monoheme cytochrome SoxX (Sulfur oxidation) n=1 Tax=Inmirania thermothiophila TaxID=1750597 RepID=A0A3N1XT01_9GAMM|nr:sulfur oxidation c-type cytochrome SoxX [Inmirania thermothiophila]ROR29784.1 monoheme cytochrome SoxX (sulfur oxidation) [Inmirania thermothiophila]